MTESDENRLTGFCFLTGAARWDETFSQSSVVDRFDFELIVTDVDHIAGIEFLPSTHLDLTIHHDVAALNEHLRLPTGSNDSAELQELIETNVIGLGFF